MRYITILEQPTKEAIKAFIEKRNLTEHFSESYHHPQEDYILASNNPPIFVVADGVTLNVKQLIGNNQKYPNPSPAGKVAQLFCEEVVNNGTARHADFSESDISVVFESANKTVEEYNRAIGKTALSGNPTGFYSATGAFVVIKENKAYWASICDAYFAHFDSTMNLKYMSSGTCTPYAVVNGEEKMLSYIEKGVVQLEKGDRVFVFTDGFEWYFEDNEFLGLFSHWTYDLQKQITDLSERMSARDPERYGHERSLIGVLFE